MNKTKKFLSIKIEPDRISGKVLRALLKGEYVNLTASENTSESIGAPDYVSIDGVSVWIKDSKY